MVIVIDKKSFGVKCGNCNNNRSEPWPNKGEKESLFLLPSIVIQFHTYSILFKLDKKNVDKKGAEPS